MNLLQTKRTYLTIAGANTALKNVCAKANIDVATVRHLIAVDADGKFATVYKIDA